MVHILLSQEYRDWPSSSTMLLLKQQDQKTLKTNKIGSIFQEQQRTTQISLTPQLEMPETLMSTFAYSSRIKYPWKLFSFQKFPSNVSGISTCNEGLHCSWKMKTNSITEMLRNFQSFSMLWWLCLYMKPSEHAMTYRRSQRRIYRAKDNLTGTK